MKIFSCFLLPALLLWSASVRAQGTTEEEYNYLTKGYAIQLSSGLDMKKGYTLKDAGNWTFDYSAGVKRTTTFKRLFRDGNPKPCAVLMIYKKSDAEPIYYCIPSADADPELWQRTMNQVREATATGLSSDMSSAVIMGLMKFTSE